MPRPVLVSICPSAVCEQEETAVKVRGLVACALVCALVGILAGGAAATATQAGGTTHHVAKKKPPKKKPAPKKKKTTTKTTAWQPDLAYDCAKYVSADRFTALAGGWGGSYTL